MALSKDQLALGMMASDCTTVGITDSTVLLLVQYRPQATSK